MNITEVVSCVIVVRGSLGRRRSLIKTLLPKHGVAALLAKSHPVTSFHLPRNPSDRQDSRRFVPFLGITQSMGLQRILTGEDSDCLGQ